MPFDHYGESYGHSYSSKGLGAKDDDEKRQAEEARGYGLLASKLFGKDPKKADERAADKMASAHQAWQASARSAKASREQLQRINTSGDFYNDQQNAYGTGSSDEYMRQQEEMRRRGIG